MSTFYHLFTMANMNTLAKSNARTKLTALLYLAYQLRTHFKTNTIRHRAGCDAVRYIKKLPGSTSCVSKAVVRMHS